MIGAAGPATILVADDDRDVREVLEAQLVALGHRVIAVGSAEEALERLADLVPDLILTDVQMGRMSGLDLCARVKRDPRLELTPVIILTGLGDLESRVAGLGAGADDFFVKPVDLLELRTRVDALLRAKRLVDQLDRAEAVITALGHTIEARDPYTGGHCERLAASAAALGQALGLDGQALRALRLAGSLHDLGKVAVPDQVLLKPGRLDPAERTVIQLHPVTGAELIRPLRTLDPVLPIVRHHHERWDGSGYPDGLAGEAIPLPARIMAVVDVYDALVTARPYKGPLPPREALAILRRETDAGFWDPRVVAAFLTTVEGA